MSKTRYQPLKFVIACPYLFCMADGDGGDMNAVEEGNPQGPAGFGMAGADPAVTASLLGWGLLFLLGRCLGGTVVGLDGLVDLLTLELPVGD